MASLKLKIWLRWFMAAAILWTQGIGLYAGESSLWDARRTSVRRLQSESAPSSTNSAKTLLAALPGPSPVAWDGAPPKRPLSTRDAVAALVAGHGWVREAHLAPRPGAPVIVHFQDAHGIEEAQRHLSVMVGRWAAANPSAPVALEGASGPIDVGGLRNFPNRSITGDIAEFLLRRGLIAGPEHAALTLEKTPDFLGAEDNALYRQNVDALRAARADNRATARWRLFQENLDRLENRLASPTLRAFDRRSRDYDAGRSSLGDFLLYLSDLKLPPGPSTPNMDALLHTLSLEKSLDFKAVEAQRRRLVETLVERLPRAALEDMVALGLDHRAGRLGPAAYHRALRSACRAHGIDLRRYGPLPAYIDYLEQADRIDRSALLAELETRRRFVQDALARTEAERVLVDLSRDLALLEKTFAQALAPADWRRYQSRRPALLTLAARTRALDPAADLTEFSPADLKPFEDFCALALRRNDALSQNLLAAVSARNAHTGLLVAGGFHTDGLTDLWRKKGVSFVVVAPALRENPSENDYLDILARDPMPIEKMIAGERVYLSRPIALASSGVVRTFYFALQRLLQNGLPTVQEAGVRLSRTPLRGGIAFQIGGTALFARFGEASNRWAARARAWGRRWADNFSPAAADRGGMMFWLPRLWNAATPKAWHINARQYRFLSVPVEAGFAGAMAWATVAAFGMPLDFDIFVRLSLAHYAAFHLLDFLTRDRRRAPFNGLMAGLIATLPGLFYALPPSWTSPAGITPAHVVYGAFLILHAAANGLLIRGRRSFRPVSPESVTLVPAGRPTPPPTGSAARSRVAVLVLTHNDTADTVRLIERMAAWPRSDDLPWELIVVDNASSDAPPALLAEAVARVPGGRLIVNVENTGAAEGRNVGLRHLLDRPTGERPDYVFLLDSDVRPTASTLKDLVAVADASPAQRVVWAPPLHFESQPDRVWRNWYHNAWRWPGQWSVDRGDALPAGDRAAVDGVATAAALVRLDAFENYGLFTPGYFFGNEDRDWCARVRKAGGEIALAPVKEKILHNVHQSLEGNLYGNFSPVRTYYILRSMMLIFFYRSPLAERTLLRLMETGLTLFRVVRVAFRTRNARVMAAAWAGLVDGVLGRDGEGRGPTFRTGASVPRVTPALPSTRLFLGGVLFGASALTGLIALTIDWTVSWAPGAAAYLGITFLLNIGVAEMALTMLLSAFLPTDAHTLKRTEFPDGIPDSARTALTYLLRSTHPENSAEAVNNMTTSYLDNLDPRGNLIAVLVSASSARDIVTRELDMVDEARERVRRFLSEEAAARGAGNTPPTPRDEFWRFHENQWDAAGLNGDDRVKAVRDLIERTAGGLKYLHRTSTVLKKPGQYLDFMALATRGMERPFNYLNQNDRRAGDPTFGARSNIEPPLSPPDPVIEALERRMARDIADLRAAGTAGNPNFRPIVFSLLMDADNQAPPRSIRRLVGYGAANRDRGFFQPGLIPSRLRTWTQLRSLLTHRWMSRIPETQFRIFGRAGAYGKGLARNDAFLEHFVGTPDAPREVLPPAMLSHDTLEALFLNPAYVGDVALYEDSPANTVGRQGQALRWTVGDLLNAAFLSPKVVGRLFDILSRRAPPERAPWRWTWPAESFPFTFEAMHIAHFSTRIFLQAPLFVVWLIMTDLAGSPGFWIAHTHPHLMLISFLIVTVGLVIMPKMYQPVRAGIEGLRAFFTGNRHAAKRSASIAAREFTIGWLEILTSPFKYFPEIVFAPLRVAQATARVVGNRLTWKVQSDAERESQRLSLAGAIRSTVAAPVGAAVWITLNWALLIPITPLVAIMLFTWVAAPVTAWIGSKPLPKFFRSSPFFRWLMEGIDAERWNEPTPVPHEADFPPTVFEPSPEGVFRDRRAPAPPTPVPPNPNDRRDQTTSPAVFDPTPAPTPVNAGPTTFPIRRGGDTAPPALTVPARLRPSPPRPVRRPSPTEAILKERLVSALFSLSGPLPRRSLLKFRVDNLRAQVDAYPAAGPFYRTLAAAWENGIERTVLLSRWSRRRTLQIPFQQLPIPVVIQGLHLVLEMRDGVPGVLFLNGQYVAPLDAQDPTPVVIGRGLLSQILKTPELDLLDFSNTHFRFWQKDGQVFLEDLSTNGTVVALPKGNDVPFEESTQFADTMDGTRFHSTRRHYLGGLLMAGFLITALFLAPVDIATAATLVPLDGGGWKAIVENGDNLWRILDVAEGGRAAEILARVSEVAQLNHLVNPNVIIPGQEIILRAGETLTPAVAEVVLPPVENLSAATPMAASLPTEWVDPLRDVVRQPLNPAPWIAAGVGVAVAGILAVGRARRSRTVDDSTSGDTSFLDSNIQWDDVVDFQDAPIEAPPAPQKEVAPRLPTAVPFALTVVALGRWARRALTQTLHALWRAPLRAALGLFGAAEKLMVDLLNAPRRWRTRFEKRRTDYDDPSTFFSHTRTGFGAPAESEPANTPTRFRRFAATFYGWITRRPLAVREVDLVPAAALGTDRLAVAPTTDGTAALAIGPNDQPLGEYTVEPPPLIDGNGPELTLEGLAAMHQETSGDPAAAAVARADRALAAETGGLAEKWQDEGLFAIPPPLLTYGDGDRVLIEIPFSRAAVKNVKRRLAAHKWLGVPLGKDLGTVLTSLYNDGWLRDPAEVSGGNTPAHLARRLAALFRNGESGAVMYDSPSEKLLVNIPAPAAWPFFFKLWWRGTREANPRGQRWTNRQEQAFFGPDTLRFPSGEPLVTQIEAAWGIDGAPRPENINLGALDAVAEYALIHFSQHDLSTFAGRDQMPEEDAKRVLVDSLREETRHKVLQAFAAAAQRALALGAPAAVGLELSLALSWRMEDVAVGREIRQRLAPQIVLIRTALSDAAARTASRSSRTPSITGERSAPPPAFGTVPGRWAMAARSTLERLPFIGPPLVNTPWLARVAAPLILALALVGLPVLALGQTAPRATWTPSEAVMTDQIPANLLKELSKSLPPGTDMAALLRGTDPATSARMLSGAVDLLRKFEGGRFLAVLEKTRPHVVLAPRGPEAAAAVDIRNKRPILYIGGAEAQPAYLFVALVHELSHLGRSDQLRAKKISPPQDEGLALEDTARAMEFYAGLSVVRIAYDQRQINEQRWIAHRFLDGTIKAAPHVLSPREVQLLTAPLRAAVHLAERRRYPGVIYLSSKNLGGGRYEVRFRVPQSGAEIVVDVTPERVSAAPGGTAGTLAMLGGIVMVRRGPPPNEDEANTARAALLRSLLRGEAGPVRFQIPTPVFKNGDNYWGATGMDDLRRRVATATADRLRDGHAATVVLLAEDAASAAAVAEGRVTEAALEAAALREAGAAAARDARDRSETTVHLNLLGFDQWEEAERDRIRHYTAGLVTALTPGTALVVPVDRPGPLGDWLDAATRRGVRVRTVTPAEAPGLANDAGQLVLSSLVDWIERENAKSAPPLARGSRVIARNDDAVVPLSGFVIIAVERLSAAIAREIETLRVLLTQA